MMHYKVHTSTEKITNTFLNTTITTLRKLATCIKCNDLFLDKDADTGYLEWPNILSFILTGFASLFLKPLCTIHNIFLIFKIGKKL